MSAKTAGIASLTIDQVRQGLTAREFSAVELTQSALAFAQAENPKTNAYLHFCPERRPSGWIRNWRRAKIPEHWQVCRWP
jgi:Asp-tRNA(Asn)/Glu-tRNA(Gln) amidotransferase A subunit family amidase